MTVLSPVFKYILIDGVGIGYSHIAILISPGNSYLRAIGVTVAVHAHKIVLHCLIRSDRTIKIHNWFAIQSRSNADSGLVSLAYFLIIYGSLINVILAFHEHKFYY